MQVLQTLRSGISVQGKPAVGICLKDLQFLSTPIKEAVKDSGLGKSGVSKDFLMPGSKLTSITREKETKSRKCTVIWLDKLEPHLKKGLVKGDKCHFAAVST